MSCPASTCRSKNSSTTSPRPPTRESLSGPLQRLALRQPIHRDALRADGQSDDATDDRAVGVHVAAGGDGGPEGVTVIVQMPLGAPEAERHGVARDDAAAV